MAITRQVITSLTGDGTDILGTKVLAVKIADESIVSGSLLTVESNHFCVLKSRGAVLNVYETGQYSLTTPDKPIVGSIVQGFFGGASAWVYEVIYINRSKLLVRSSGVATSAEMAEMVMTRLRFPRQEIDLVVEAVRNHMVFKDVQQMRPAKLRRFMARPHFGIELELHRIDCAGSHGDLENYQFLVRKSSEFSQEPLIPAPLVRGDDLLSMGLKQGPKIGELLEAVQTAQLEGDVTTRAEALDLLRAILDRN